VSVLVIIAGLIAKREQDEFAPTRRQKAADLFTLGVAIFILRGAEVGTYSATATVVTILGVAICLALLWRRRGGRFIAPHLPSIAIASVGAYFVLGTLMTSTGAAMLGRRSDLTGRSTEIWPLVLQEAATHPILGSGYGGVWGLGGPLSTTLRLEQAHNGYLDVYLQLGIVGCVLLALFLLEFAARVGRQFKYSRRWGIFGIAFFFINLIYNISETAFFDVYMGAIMVFMTVIFADSDSRVALRAAQPTSGRPIRQVAGWSRPPLRPVRPPTRWMPPRPASRRST
jgi:O-antigen ligase